MMGEVKAYRSINMLRCDIYKFTIIYEERMRFVQMYGARQNLET